MSDDGVDLPVVDRDTVEAAVGDRTDGDEGGDYRVGGVLLAAGRSTRFGDANKLLETVDGEPMVRRAALTLLDADLSRVIVVVGHEADRVRAALDGLDVDVPEIEGPAGEGAAGRETDGDGTDSEGTDGEKPAGEGLDGEGLALDVRVNPDYEQGQSTSVRVGVRGLESGQAVDAAVFALGDMPSVRPGTVDLLVDAFRAGIGDPLAAAYRGRRGNPVLFGARHFEALADTTGDTGGREILLDGDEAALVETGDPGVVQDVDTPGDLERMR